MTKLDKARKGIGALCECKYSHYPISFIGCGPNIDDLREYDPQKLISSLLGDLDLKSPYQKLHDLKLELPSRIQDESNDTHDTITMRYVTQLFAKLTMLQDQIGCIPRTFSALGKKHHDLFQKSFGTQKNPIYNKEWAEKLYHFWKFDDIRPDDIGFDINRFLEVFDKINLKKNYVLDYAYEFSSLNAEPLIYTEVSRKH
ncbi:MAG: hypothetical protein BAJALOKI1v1_1100014 [Promethearchaeota archaeon]|nr:MAG: hypothetical protein BAJALOKI1v1_1100014 [Candidatus Lokiarchaeota archaeon]